MTRALFRSPRRRLAPELAAAAPGRRRFAPRIALALVLACGDAAALDPPPAGRGTCPDPDGVWSSVRALVPSAADQWSAARPRVEIVDEGERYRVRVTTASGRILERVYSDAARDCATRTRFAAEFIVVALMPPTIGDGVGAPAAGPAANGTGATTGAGAPAAPAATAPPPPATASPGATPAAPSATPGGPPSATASAKPPAVASASSSRDESSLEPVRSRARWRWLRIEIEALGEAAPKAFGASSVLTIGPEVRARFGRGTWSAFGSAAYEPPALMMPAGVAVRVVRVPIAAGARLRRRFGRFEVDGDFGAALAIETYDAPALHQTNTVVHVAPGLQAGAEAAWEAAGVLGFVAGIRCTWLPLSQDLVSAPAGDLGKTPSLWLGAVLGASLEP
jgi:hypothetical protein